MKLKVHDRVWRVVSAVLAIVVFSSVMAACQKAAPYTDLIERIQVKDDGFYLDGLTWLADWDTTKKEERLSDGDVQDYMELGYSLTKGNLNLENPKRAAKRRLIWASPQEKKLAAIGYQFEFENKTEADAFMAQLRKQLGEKIPEFMLVIGNDGSTDRFSWQTSTASGEKSGVIWLQKMGDNTVLLQIDSPKQNKTGLG